MHWHAVRNENTNTSVFSTTRMAEAAKHQLAMANSNNIGIQPVSLLQTDPQIVERSPTSLPNEQRMRVSILYHNYTVPLLRKRNSSLSLPLYSVIFLFKFSV